MANFPMQARDVTSKTIDGISDLVVWAPIREGFIPAFANVTYESRLRLVAEALHNVRVSAREHETLEPFADTARRILSLLDFRIGIVDRDMLTPVGEADGAGGLRPRKYMYLVATFDGPWEPYMRLIWRPLGAFLDLVLVNCDGYKPAMENGFETYAKWVRDHQLDSAIFYSTSGLTVKDKIYLEELEKTQRFETANSSFETIARMTSNNPDEDAEAVRGDPRNAPEVLRLAFEALNVLYKLADYYPADAIQSGGDGRYLLRAAQSLLSKFPFRDLPNIPELKAVFKDQIDWFSELLPEDDIEREPDPPLETSEIQKGLLTGYDTPDTTVTHGVVLLMRIDDAAKMREFLRLVPWSFEADDAPSPFVNTFWNRIYRNIAFAYSGLEKIGTSEAELSVFPKEFRQGMAERAPQLGDKYQNHPRRWRLPARNWPRDQDDNNNPIELSEIDFVIQARSGVFVNQDGQEISSADLSSTFQRFSDTARQFARGEGRAGADPLAAELIWRFEDQFSQDKTNDEGDDGEHVPGAFDWLLAAFMQQQDGDKPVSPLDVFILFVDHLGARFGFTILGIEDMFRPDPINADEVETQASTSQTSARVDHFGFLDGLSQPVIADKPIEQLAPYEVYPGDILYGYRNTRTDTHLAGMRGSLMFNGSFLVVRKISQDVAAFRKFEDDHPGLNIAERIVGRHRDGRALVDPGCRDNDFNYETDTKGEACPFSAHIRLAHPRGMFHGRKDPMILRRGMSYGRRYDPDASGDAGRGIVFMAYCASLAEQYEIVQRWLNAGNASHVATMHNDPLTGARPRDGASMFRFITDQPDPVTGSMVRTARVDTPFTQLEWGAYFFAPSRTAIARVAREPEAQDTAWRLASGRAVIRQIEALPKFVQQEEWKRILEDFLTKDPTRHDIAPRVYHAIQADGGAYRIESGVAFDRGAETAAQPVILVTDEAEIRRIFLNKCPVSSGTGTDHVRPFSSREQDRRLAVPESFGQIYVAMDAPCSHGDAPEAFKDSQYFREAEPTNAFIMAYGFDQALQAGYLSGISVLDAIKTVAETLYNRDPRPADVKGPLQTKIELGRQYIQPTMARVCELWFGIPNKDYIVEGPWTWPEKAKPVCPGDFLSTSRKTFYPRPTPAIEAYGLKHGYALRAAVNRYIDDFWANDELITGKIAKQMHQAMRERAAQPDAPHGEDHYKDILARNLVGIMIGAIPPMDANLRWALFDWLEEKALWTHQDRFLRKKSEASAFEAAKLTLTGPLGNAMSVRPAPDLIYRTVERDDVPIGNTVASKGDLVILCLSAAMQKALNEGTPKVDLVFGGDRKTATGDVNPDHPLHACPAKDMAMGAMVGILAALLDAGRIQALPASLIVGLSRWDPVAGPPGQNV